MNKAIFFNLILVAILLVIAALVFVRFNPIEKTHLNGSDVDRLAQQLVRGEDHMTVEELSERIIKARADFMLVDLRPEDRFNAGHIKSATHIPLTDLVKPDTLAGLPTDRAVILYSDSTSSAAQAAVILRLSGIPAYSLVGGYNYWAAYMTDPAAAGIVADDARQRAKYDAIRCFLEGDYVAEAGLVVRQPASAGFTPPLEPAEKDTVEDPLGLGLGLGLGSEPASGVAPDAGLGLGLGGGRTPRGLKIRKGC